MLHEDYRDIFLELFAAQADFLVIGAFAMAGHGMMRTTGDLDLWVRPNPENADRVWAADILVHDYRGVNLKNVWFAATESVRSLIEVLEPLIPQAEDPDL